MTISCRVSIALTGIRVSGFNKIAPTDSTRAGNDFMLDLMFPKLTIWADKYIAGGFFKTLPFVGESTLK